MKLYHVTQLNKALFWSHEDILSQDIKGIILWTTTFLTFKELIFLEKVFFKE
jgi:hypothetical protein